MATKKTRIKQEAPSIQVPQSREAVVDAIAEIGARQRAREVIQAAMNEELSAVRQRFEEQALPHSQAIAALTQGVQIWCEANRLELTNQGKVKTCRLASGEIKWRMRPPRVSLRSVEAVIEALKFLKLTQFIRVKEEVDKEAVLADPEAVKQIKGITVTQGEDFVIVPFETRLEEVAG